MTGKDEALSILLQANCEHINNKGGEWNNTALMCAAFNGHSTSIEILIQHGAELNVKDNDGDTALIDAARYGHSTSIEILLQHGTKLNVKNNKGNTALICAARKGHSTSIEILIKHSADVSLKNNNGKTAHDRAKNKKIKVMLQPSRQNNAKITSV